MLGDPALAWIRGACGFNALVALLPMLAFGAGARGTDIALQATARVSFGLFVAAYLAGPLVRLCGDRFLALRARARSLGLAFAAAQTIHLALVVWLCCIGAPPAFGVFLTFAFPTVCIVALVAFSLPRWERWSRGRRARWVRGGAMHVIAASFAFDFLRFDVQGAKFWLGYAPFLFCALAAPALHLLALWRTGPSTHQANKAIASSL